MEEVLSFEEGMALLSSVKELLADLPSWVAEVPDDELGPLFAQLCLLGEGAEAMRVKLRDEAMRVKLRDEAVSRGMIAAAEGGPHPSR